MKRLRSSCTILGAIAICICIGLFGIKVSANTITEEMDVQTYKPKSISNEQPGMLFENYLESLDEEGNAPRVKKTAGSKLTGIDKAIYTKLSQYISQVAAGERASTVFDIPVEELGLEQLTWTASELGVEAIIVDEAFSDDAVAAVRAKCTYHSSQIIQALLADNPYGLYWYEKTKNTSTKGYQITADYDTDKDEYVIGIEGSISMSFPVAEEYSAGEYTFDTAIGKSVQFIVENATAIVSKYAAATDYEKLQGYRQEICDRVSYNHTAASGSVSYGNPWQLIWVFDDDSSTNVVCEGYSKAFQYLCNLTDFTDEIDCICVSGTMQGGTGAGPHMWNIVTMDDRKNYLADVTNCDSGTIGADTQLFLVGYTSKESDTQYTFKCNSGNIVYVYNEKTTNLFSEELEIHNTKYVTHTFGDWTVTKEATCTEAGSRERTCSDCGIKVTEEIPALGHSWSETYIVDKEATCAEEGSESIHCTVCGEIKEGSARAIEKKDHTYGEWTVTKEASCTETGSKEKICSVCKDKVTEEIPALGHTWSESYTVDKEATCAEEGSESIHCTVCGEIKEGSSRAIKKKDHTWDEGKVTLEPTGNKPGIKTFTCTVCGATKTEDIPATGTHNYVGTVTKEPTCTETGIMTYTCTDEDCTSSYTEEIPAKGHSWSENYTVDKEATCAEEGSESIHCTVCGAIKEGSARAIEKKDHSYGDWTITKEATCTETGSKEKICSVCKDKVTEEIPAKGHSWSDTYTVDKEATCAEEGSESIHCSVCDAVKEGSSRAIEKKEHNYSDWTVTKDATCTETGSKEKICSVCKDKVTEEIPAKGHSWSETYTVDKEATCAEEGSESIHCSVCDAVKEGSSRTIEKKEHTYGEWTVSKEATCTQEGLREKVCSACKDKVTATIPVIDHSWDEGKVTLEPTGNKPGIKTFTCSVCGTTKTEDIPATGTHNYVGTVTTEPTCTEKGVMTYTCTDEDCTASYTEEIPAKGHSWSETYIVDKEATCAEEGSESIHCSVCGAIKEGSSRAIEKKEHTYGDWTVTKEASCTEAGLKEKVCSVCKDKVTEEIPALGHSWSETYTVDKEATCAEEGSESIHCSVCGAIKEGSARAIEKKEHTYGDWTVTKEATCTETGLKEKVCSVCKDKVTQTIPVIDHTWDEGTVTLQPTGNKPGIKTFTCGVCGATKTEDIPATGTHNYVGTVTTEPTCTEKGVMTYTCTDVDCTASYTEEIPALGHSWNETYIVDKEATCAEEGSESIHCQLCGVTKEGSSRTIPATGRHIEATPVTENEIPATYLADGSFDSVIYCISCGKELSRETITVPKLTAKDQVISVAKTSYNFIFSSSKVQSQAVSVSGAKGKLSYTSSRSSYVYIKDGKIYVARSAPAGTYTISIRAAETEDGEYKASNSVTVKVKVAKASNTIKVTPATKKLKVAKIKKKAQSFQLKVTQAQGKITYKSSSSKVKVTATGKVTVKKGTKKGKYRITVTANGNGNYNKGVKTVVITVK